MANKPVNPRVGSDFDQFLEQEGLLEESAAVAMKRVIAWQLAEAMKTQGVNKSEMALRMRTSRSQLDRILGEQGSGMTLETLSRAIDALGLGIRLEMSGKKAVKPVKRKVATKQARSPKQERQLAGARPRKSSSAKQQTVARNRA